MIDPWDLRWCRQVAITAAATIAAAAFYMLYRAMTAPPAVSGSVTADCVTGTFSFRAHAYYTSDGRRWRIDHYLYRFRGGDGRGGGGGLFASSNPRGTFNDLNVAVMTNGRLVGWDSSPDDRRSGVLYRMAVRTDDDANISRSDRTVLSFRAAFDVADGFDPICIADSPPLPVAG